MSEEQSTPVVSEEAPEEAMGEPEGPAQEKLTKLTELDKLRLQNAFLKFHAVTVQMTNIRTQMEVLRRDAAKADETFVKERANLEGIRADIAKRYDVDMEKMTVDQEGNFIPMDQSKMPFPTGGQR